MIKMSFSSVSGNNTNVKFNTNTPKKNKNMLFLNNSSSKKEVINSYAFKNPSLFGDGMGVINKSGSNTNIDRSNMKNMLGRLDGLKPGCSSCGGKK